MGSEVGQKVKKREIERERGEKRLEGGGGRGTKWDERRDGEKEEESE